MYCVWLSVASRGTWIEGTQVTRAVGPLLSAELCRCRGGFTLLCRRAREFMDFDFSI